MRVLSCITAALFILCGITLAVCIVLLWAQTDAIPGTAEFLKANIHRLGPASLVLILIGIAWVTSWFDYLYRRSSITFDNPGGKVKVSIRAIEQFVTSRISVLIPGVKSLRVSASLSARGLETLINLKLLAGINIPETCANIQDITKNYLQDVVGVERVSNIEIFVSSILTKGHEEPEEPPAEKEQTQDETVQEA